MTISAKRFFVLLVLGILPLSLAACGPGGMTKSDSGAIIGAVTGGVIGSHFGGGVGKVAATAVGAVIGGIVGSEIGRALDEADRRAAMEAEYRALETAPSGSSVPWRNPDTGHYGTVVPEKPYVMNGRHCRRYTHTIYIDGEPEILKGQACRNPDGTWRAVS